MIKSVKGNLISKDTTLATVGVGGVGLAISIPISTYSALPEVNKSVTLYTHLHVREDQLKLYGFATTAECDLFNLLIGVNKIGPGVALQVLSSCNVEEFRNLVANEDVKSLASMIKGVGKKTAQRMVLELKDKIGEVSPHQDPELKNTAASSDAIKALVELGASPSQARKEVKKAIEDTDDNAPSDVILHKVFENR